MMTLSDFCEANPNLQRFRSISEIQVSKIDFEQLNIAIKKSHFLQSRVSLNWVIDNSARIIAGKYRDYPRFSKNNDYVAPKFGNERTYTKQDFDAVFTRVEDLNF